MNERDLARYYAGGRVGVGLLLFLFPRRTSKLLWGDEMARSAAVGFYSRMVGVRDVIIGAGAIFALQQEADGTAKGLARPWMTYGAVADAVDAFATLVAFRQLPAWKRFFLLAMALSGVGTGGYLMTALDAPD